MKIQSGYSCFGALGASSLAPAAGTIGYTVNAANQITATTAAKTADRAAIQTRISHKEVGIPAGAITSYGYDSLKRLTAATERTGSTVNASWTYAYDKAGNRTSQTRAGNTSAPAGTTTYTYNVANQLTTSSGAPAGYQYDAAGNQKVNGATGQTATYNTRQAVTAIGSSTYTAFGQGNTDTLTRSASSTSYTTASLGLMTETTSNGTTAYTRTNTGTPVAGRGTGGATSYYIRDSLGSVIGLFDKTGTFTGGYSYAPYGELRGNSNNAATNANAIRYTAGYWDTSVSLYRLGARYYDPITARFSQYDPSGQEGNPYVYAASNPVNYNDPTGLAYGQVGVDFCLLACIGFGAGYDGDFDFSVNGAVGAEVGATLYGGGGFGTNEGTSFDAGCSGAVGPVGVYGEVGTGGAGDYSGGGGISTGLNAGCSFGVSYTF